MYLPYPRKLWTYQKGFFAWECFQFYFLTKLLFLMCGTLTFNLLEMTSTSPHKHYVCYFYCSKSCQEFRTKSITSEKVTQFFVIKHTTMTTVYCLFLSSSPKTDDIQSLLKCYLFLTWSLVNHLSDCYGIKTKNRLHKLTRKCLAAVG